jgi:hypothetical protein
MGKRPRGHRGSAAYRCPARPHYSRGGRRQRPTVQPCRGEAETYLPPATAKTYAMGAPLEEGPSSHRACSRCVGATLSGMPWQFASPPLAAEPRVGASPHHPGRNSLSDPAGSLAASRPGTRRRPASPSAVLRRRLPRTRRPKLLTRRHFVFRRRCYRSALRTPPQQVHRPRRVTPEGLTSDG